jgi:serine/threonine protein kinase
MDANRWADLETIFSAALELHGEARAEFLADRCAADPALRAEVLSLLSAHDAAGSFLDDGPARLDGDARLDPRHFLGRTLGNFRLTGLIGEGGMGAVFRADRITGGFAQQVAVKVLRPEAVAGAGWQRFRNERQALAQLDHPYVVRLIDGFAEGDCACLVMELVEGTPITEYCVSHDLSIEQRLALFQRVCTGVHGAHRHGVIHRDLKPTNILVTADGLPKVLDFGVAKLLDAPADDPNQTAPGVARPLTPNYASPEQLRGESGTQTSDVYALGVVLYEVLTGVRPYDARGKSLGELVRSIETGRIVPVSQAVRRRPDTGDRLSADLDAIVARALHPDAAQRHPTVEALSAEIDTYLARVSRSLPLPAPARSPHLAGVLVLVGVIGGAVIVGSLATRDQPRTAADPSATPLPIAAAPVPSVAPPSVSPPREVGLAEAPPVSPVPPTPSAPAPSTPVSPAVAAKLADLMQRGLALARSRVAGAWPDGIALLRQAVDLDPQSGRATAALAEGLALARLAEDRAEAVRLAARAVTIDPQCGDCLATRGYTRMFVTHEWEAARQDLLRAASMAPRTPAAGSWLGTLQAWTGDAQGAVDTLDRELQDNPQSVSLLHNRTAALFFQRAFDSTVEAANRTLNLDSGFYQVLGFKWMSLLRLGRTGEAVRPLMNDYLGRVPQAAATAAIADATATYSTAGVNGLMADLVSRPGARRSFFKAVM